MYTFGVRTPSKVETSRKSSSKCLPTGGQSVSLAFDPTPVVQVAGIVGALNVSVGLANELGDSGLVAVFGHGGMEMALLVEHERPTGYCGGGPWPSVCGGDEVVEASEEVGQNNRGRRVHVAGAPLRRTRLQLV